MQRPKKSLDGLPAELIDEVLSYFPDPDLAVLRCCSLVCKSWRIRSQLILFKNVSLWNESRLQSWCATIPPSPTGISSFVRTLELGGRWIRPEVLEQHITHFTSLRKVRTLDVHDVDFKPFNEITFPRYFGQLGSSVQTLRLESCRSSIETYLELLKHFGKLEELYVSSDTSSTRDPGVVVEVKGVSGVGGGVCKVTVDLDKAALPLWLASIPWKVQEADVVVTTKSGKSFALDTLLAAPTHDLQRLHIELTKPQSQPEKYSLTACTSLQQIRFSAVAIKRPCDSISPTLSTIGSRHLMKVVFEVSCGEVICQRKFDAEVDFSSWQPVDQALCALAEKVDSGNRGGGEEFEVVVRVDGPKEVVKAVSGSKMFSGLRRKGVVTVSRV